MGLSAITGPCLGVQSIDRPDILLGGNQPALQLGFINFVNTFVQIKGQMVGR